MTFTEIKKIEIDEKELVRSLIRDLIEDGAVDDSLLDEISEQIDEDSVEWAETHPKEYAQLRTCVINILTKGIDSL